LLYWYKGTCFTGTTVYILTLRGKAAAASGGRISVLALLVQRHLRYWYKRTHTDAARENRSSVWRNLSQIPPVKLRTRITGGLVAYVTSAYVSIRQHTSAYVSIRQHTSAYVSIRQHTSAYVSIRQASYTHRRWSSTLVLCTTNLWLCGTFSATHLAVLSLASQFATELSLASQLATELGVVYLLY
jgi:hypothetical protein